MPLDFPALRQRLASLDIASLTRLEEACAPLVPLWLPARYEGSPLALLRPFDTDTATLRAFTESLRHFAEAEIERDRQLAAHPASFEVDDPTPTAPGWPPRSTPCWHSGKNSANAWRAGYPCSAASPRGR